MRLAADAANRNIRIGGINWKSFFVCSIHVLRANRFGTLEKSMKLHLFCGLAALALTLPATAQTPSRGYYNRSRDSRASDSRANDRRASYDRAAPLRCNGQLATIRTSTVRPGKWDEFARAVAAHDSWYAHHGGSAKVTLARVIHRNPRSGASDYADGEAVTITVFRDANGSVPQHDRGWDDFVSAYAASSQVAKEARVCLPART